MGASADIWSYRVEWSDVGTVPASWGLCCLLLRSGPKRVNSVPKDWPENRSSFLLRNAGTHTVPKYAVSYLRRRDSWTCVLPYKFLIDKSARMESFLELRWWAVIHSQWRPHHAVRYQNFAMISGSLKKEYDPSPDIDAKADLTSKDILTLSVALQQYRKNFSCSKTIWESLNPAWVTKQLLTAYLIL